MVDQQELRKAQLKMVEILDAIDEICTKHDIKWWLCYGTMLGAVRHNGFIPWDDDCDIAMLREDYERFIEFAKKELPSNLHLQNREFEPKYNKSITKIRMDGTKLVSIEEKENEPYHQGIFVDIFVWDYHPKINETILKDISWITKLRYKRKKYPRGHWKRSAIQVVSALPYLFYSCTLKVCTAVSLLYRKNKSLPYVGTEFKTTDKVFCKQEIIFPLKRDIPFEGKYFPVPNDCDAFLTYKYGDYMTLPPVGQRRIHARSIKC